MEQARIVNLSPQQQEVEKLEDSEGNVDNQKEREVKRVKGSGTETKIKSRTGSEKGYDGRWASAEPDAWRSVLTELSLCFSD